MQLAREKEKSERLDKDVQHYHEIAQKWKTQALRLEKKLNMLSQGSSSSTMAKIGNEFFPNKSEKSNKKYFKYFVKFVVCKLGRIQVKAVCSMLTIIIFL